jgi:hypothetical protein
VSAPVAADTPATTSTMPVARSAKVLRIADSPQDRRED